MITPHGRTAELTEDVNPIRELHQGIAAIDQEIARLLIRKNSNDQFGDRRYQSLNSQRYRSQIDELGMRRESLIHELESLGVKYVRKVQLKESPMPTMIFHFMVIAGGPTGLMTLSGGSIGCPHEIEGRDYEAAEFRAIEEHKEKCV